MKEDVVLMKTMCWSSFWTIDGLAFVELVAGSRHWKIEPLALQSDLSGQQPF